MSDDLTARLRELVEVGIFEMPLLGHRDTLREASDRIEAVEAERDAALADVAKLRETLTETRVRAERYENGAELYIVHDEVKVETHDPSGGCAEAWGADCETVPLYTLDPPLTRKDRP